jgi:hypothetical protein
MRQLTNQEVTEVSGGFFNIPGGVPGVVGGVYLGWQIGSELGAGINAFNQNVSGMSLGEAIYRSGDS